MNIQNLLTLAEHLVNILKPLHEQHLELSIKKRVFCNERRSPEDFVMANLNDAICKVLNQSYIKAAELEAQLLAKGRLYFDPDANSELDTDSTPFTGFGYDFNVVADDILITDIDIQMDSFEVDDTYVEGEIADEWSVRQQLGLSGITQSVKTKPITIAANRRVAEIILDNLKWPYTPSKPITTNDFTRNEIIWMGGLLDTVDKLMKENHETLTPFSAFRYRLQPED